MEYIDFKAFEPVQEELSSIDLSDILDHVAKGDFQAASATAFALLGEGFFDIRLVGYYLFGFCFDDFEASGVYAFSAFTEVMSRFEAMKPTKYKERQCKTAIDWFLTNLINHLEYRESKASRLCLSQEVYDALQSLEAEISKALGQSSDLIVKLRRFFIDRIQKESDPITETTCETVKSVEASSQSMPEQPIVRTTQGALKGSSKWLELLDKLNTLDVLQSKEADVEAAALYRHIYHLLSRFNPLEYFPEYLAAFFQKTLDPSFQRIIDQTEAHITSVQWTALEGLIESDHRLLLNGQFGLSGSSKTVTQDKFHSLIETDQFRNNPISNPSYPQPTPSYDSQDRMQHNPYQNGAAERGMHGGMSPEHRHNPYADPHMADHSPYNGMP